jgi:demethylmenaquinone methyltransferase/2-methoxy-6-polyprenyl-1,4-benzoquinol methylase
LNIAAILTGRRILIEMDLFHWVAPYYDRIFHFSDATQLLDLLELEPQHCLLDVGGGTGRVTSVLAEHVGQACIIDVSPGMLFEARDKGLCAYQGVAEQLPFPDGAFDRILIVDAFHHFQDWPRAAAELLRVLRPGGRMVVEELDIRNKVVKLVALGERLLLMRSRFYAPADLAQLFQTVGGRVALHDNRDGVYWAVIRR